MTANPYRRRVPRSHRRVMLVLLTDAANLGGYTICRAAGIGSGSAYPALARLEKLGWLDSEWETPEPVNRPRRRFYRLTPDGRAHVMELLGLTVREEVAS
jgi:DNA-binding PadR family transcriptional regulator